MAFRNAIEDVASVEDYYIQRRWDGPGTTHIMIKPPQYEVLEEVTYAIGVVSAVDEEYTIIGAENKPININLNITLSTEDESPTGTLEKDKTTREVEESLKNYMKEAIIR